MTVANTEGGGAVVPYNDDFANLGLEDVGAADLIMPRIGIDHDKGVFKNSLTGQEFPALTAVFLGMVKQRIMWPSKLEDGDKPMCKSPDNTHGFPRVGDNVPRSKQFPFADSNFVPENMQLIELEPSAQHPNGWSSNGYGVLPCDTCSFAKWGKDADGKSVPPPCSEQHTYPILYMQQEINEDGSNGEISWVPALFTVQRSAIKNSRAYINSFAQAKQPMFTVYTGLTLTMESRGKNSYAVPNFKRMSATDRNNWGDYGNQLRGIREFIRSAPRAQDDEDGAQAAAGSNENTAPAPAPVATPAPAPSAPVAPPTPAPAPAPVAEAPVAPPAPAPAPPAPPAPAAPAAPPAPPAPTEAAAPPAPPAAPAAAPVAAPSDDEDLPF